MVESVEISLLPSLQYWDDIQSPMDQELIQVMLSRAWGFP